MADLDLVGSNSPLAAYQDYVRQVMADRGFDDETVSQKFMLLLEEAGEFAKAARSQAHLKEAADVSNDDARDCAADLFAILLDICSQLGIDLEGVFRHREQQNQNRSWE